MKREEVLILARAFYPKSQVEKLEKVIFKLKQNVKEQMRDL